MTTFGEIPVGQHFWIELTDSIGRPYSVRAFKRDEEGADYQGKMFPSDYRYHKVNPENPSRTL